MRQCGAVEGPDGRRLRRRARLQLQHRSAEEEELPEPKCWADLTKPAFKDEIQVANPNSSGTSYTMLATFVQLMGEDKAFEYLKALHKNVNQYTKSGAAPARRGGHRRDAWSASRSMHDAVVQAVGGAPVKIVVAVRRHRLRDRQMSIIKGAQEPGERQEVVRLGAHARSAEHRRAGEGRYQVPSNKNAHDAAAGAEVRRDQAHQLRLRQVRLVGRAHAAADEVGQGSLDAAEVSVTGSPADRAGGELASRRPPAA